MADATTFRRWAPTAVKAAVLVGGVVGVWRFYHLRTAADLPVADDDDVNVSPLVTVQTGRVTRATVRAYADGYGTVEPEPGRDGRPPAGVDVAVPATAVVAAVAVGEGDRVTAGQVLFQLDDRAAAAAVARAAAVRRAADRAAAAVAGGAARDTARLDRDAADAAADLARAEADRQRLTVVAPAAGTVVALHVHPGGVATAGVAAVQLVDLSRLTIATPVPATALADVRPGTPAVVSVDGHDCPAAVTFVDPAVDPATGDRSVDVSVDVSVTGAILRPGQVLHVRLTTAEHRDVLTVPADSLVEDADGASVRSVERDFRWSLRVPVAVGLRDGDRVEVSGDGVHDGQDVVTVGAFALPDHARIEVAK